MVKINLLPLKIKKTNVALKLYTYILIGSSIIILILVFLLVNLVAQTNRTKQKITELESKRQELAEQIEPIRVLMKQDQEIQASNQLLSRLASGQATWISILDELADQINQDLWLRQLTAQALPENNGWKIQLDGEAYHKISVADFLANLEKATLFTNVKLEALNDQEEKQASSVRFKVSMHTYQTKPSRPGGQP